jgi:predicted ATP-grasp superfamily ATP-dependent carboligase
MSPRVLVTDGEHRAALACVRSLGLSGHSCFVIGPEMGDLAGASRYCKGRETLTDPGVDAQAFLEGLQERVRRWEIEFLLPITEKGLRAVLPAMDLFPGVNIPFPSYEVFSRVSDKALVLAAAREAGIAVPKQWRWNSREDATAFRMDEKAFPLVIKPTRSVPQLRGAVGQLSVAHIPGPDRMRAWLEAAGDRPYPVLVQERVEGEGAGVFLLLWDGIVRGVVGHRRIREKPPSGGVSVMRESTVVEPGLLQQSVALLRGLGWEDGVVMVEYKVEPGSGQAWLMEINGRFWGSLQMAVDAGVDFPALLLQCAQGNPPSSPVIGKPGVRTRWLLRDLDQLIRRLARPRKTLNVPPSFPGRGRAILEFLWDFRPGVHLEVLKISDPRPFLVEAGAWLRALGR